MFSARDLLGQVMQTAMNDTTARRVRHALGPQGLGAAGSPLAGLFGPGGGLGGLADSAGSMLGEAGRAVQGGNPLAVGGLGALAGAVFGGGGGALRGALGGGVLAMLSGLAFSALSKGQAAPAPAETAAEAAPLGLREPQNPGRGGGARAARAAGAAGDDQRRQGRRPDRWRRGPADRRQARGGRRRRGGAWLRARRAAPAAGPRRAAARGRQQGDCGRDLRRLVARDRGRHAGRARLSASPRRAPEPRSATRCGGCTARSTRR